MNIKTSEQSTYYIRDLMIKQLLFKILLLAIIAVLIVELTIRFSPFREKDLATDFAAAMIDKQDLLQRTNSPKVIVIGGSSVAYGVDTQLMSDSLGLPVLNMSYQYFLGSDFLFRQVAESLNKGDKVIASFEYMVTKEGDKKEQLRAASYYPKAIEWIEFETIPQYISSWLRFRIDLFRKVILRLYDRTPFNPTVDDTESTFFRGAINSHGDLVSHLNNDPLQFAMCNTTKDSAFYPVIENVSHYTNLLRKKGVEVYYTFPPYEESSFASDKPLVDTLINQFSKYPNIILLDSPYDNKYPNSYFQDMCYHLNAVGRRERTINLVQDFKNVALKHAL